MADGTDNETLRDAQLCTQLYNDTMYFVDAMVTDYDYYHRVLDLVKDADTEIAMHTKTVKKNVDEDWVRAIEDSLFALDHVVRNPARYIKEVEEVVPIERARNINSKSIQDLCRHSDYISSVDGDEIMPSKILNVYRDETLDVYENKFINTLIKRLYDFLEKRYPHICGGGSEENVREVTIKSEFKDGDRRGTFTLGIETADPETKSADGGKRDLVERVDKLMGVVKSYMHTELVETLGKTYIRPPVMHTNAILKNKNLRQCLDLWEYIESYDKIGYQIEVQEKLEKPNDKFVSDLYSMLGLQYVIFKYNTDREDNLVVGEHDSDNPIAPRFSTEYNPYDSEDFTVFDSEYKKVVPYSELSLRRHLSPDEVTIRTALEDALVASVAYDAKSPLADIEKALEDAEEARKELARIKAEEEKKAKEAERKAKKAEAERRAAEEKIRLEAELAEQKKAEEQAAEKPVQTEEIANTESEVEDNITESESVPVISEIPVTEDISIPEPDEESPEEEPAEEVKAPESEPAESDERAREEFESEEEEIISAEEKAEEKEFDLKIPIDVVLDGIPPSGEIFSGITEDEARFEAEAEAEAKAAEEAMKKAEEREKYLKAGRKRKKKMKKEAEKKSGSENKK